MDTTEFYAMTDIARPEIWPPWPDTHTVLHLNRKLPHDMTDHLRELTGQGHFNGWPQIRITLGEYVWAFGHSADSHDHIETQKGAADGVIPCNGWQGVMIEWPERRRFASSVVMAKRRGTDTAFCCPQDASKAPAKGCLGRNGKCHAMSEAIFIQPFDSFNREHQLLGEHKYQECPDCFRLGDRCSRMNRMGKRNQAPSNGPEAWMQEHKFRKTEGGLETSVTFEGVEVQVLCYPEPLVYDKSVWDLGQKASAGDRSGRHLFDAALMLNNDRTKNSQPKSLADVLLLLNHVTKPQPTKMHKLLPKAAAVHAAASADVFQVMMEAVESDREMLSEHTKQKSAIADVLASECSFSLQPKTADPEGWLTFPLKPADEWNRHRVDECFHGTCMTALAPILLQGLKKPQTSAAVAHGQHGSESKQTIYASPSWHYAAHPVYSPLHRWTSGGRDQAVQMVLKCDVLHGGYRAQKGTLGNKHWSRELRVDPEHDTMDDLEYLIEDEGNICLKGIMFRQFGPGADPKIYGDLAPQLSMHRNGPSIEYRWTAMLQEDFKERGLLLREE